MPRFRIAFPIVFPKCVHELRSHNEFPIVFPQIRSQSAFPNYVPKMRSKDAFPNFVLKMHSQLHSPFAHRNCDVPSGGGGAYDLEIHFNLRLKAIFFSRMAEFFISAHCGHFKRDNDNKGNVVISLCTVIFYYSSYE